MADTLTINTDDAAPVATSWLVHYDADNRQKRIERNTSVNPTAILKVNLLYSALQNHFDELTQMDDGTPMSAQTPTEYTIGVIDAGDKDPWFIDRTSVEYLKGGAIKTASWTRAPLVGDGTGTVGIVQIKYTATTPLDATDIGRDILMTIDGDRGTILDFNATGATKYMWVRPDDNTAANSFNNAPTDGGAFTIPTDTLGQAWQVDVSAGAGGFSDQTTDANDAGTNDWIIFPATEENTIDYAAIGFRQKFKKVTFDSTSGTQGTVGAVAWEYWNGTTWTALSGVSDGTTGFTAALGSGQNLTFTVPTDWAATSLGGSAILYYIRARVTTLYTVNPVYTQAVIGTTGATLAQVNIAGGGTAITGGSLWANIYNTGLANIESFTHQYVYQNALVLTKYKSATIDWWGDGQIDILINIKELDVESDEGYVTVFARQYSKTYDHFIVDLTAGGRNPIPLATGADLNNTTGWRQFTGQSGVNSFDVGNFMYVGATWATATKRAKITKVAGTVAAPILDYYLLGDLALADFTQGSPGDSVKEYVESTGADGDATCDVNASAPVYAVLGPQTFDPSTTTMTITHAQNATFDINEVAPNELYSIVIDLGDGASSPRYSVAQGYEFTKFITRRGFITPDTFTDGINGEAYIGSDYRLSYTTAVSGTLAEGDTVTQATSLAAGTVVARHTGTNLFILRNSRLTFTTTGVVTGNQAGFFTPDLGATAITAIKAAPFGTFAGGTWFAAPGVVFANPLAADANKYQLTDDQGNVVVAPTKVTVTVGNTILGDRVAVFRLTTAGGTVKKNTYNATVQATGLTTAVMGATIAVDEPGKTAGGVLRLVDTSSSSEYRIRFGSWTASTFKLAGHVDHDNTTGKVADAGTTTTVIVDTGTFTNSKVGDLIRNTSQSAISYITVVTDANTVTISPAITGQTTGSTFDVNVLPVATTTTPQDTWYVPLIDSFETTGTSGTPGSETAQVTFSANIPVRVRARRTVATAILPYEADSTVTSTGMSSNIIRTPDTIFT
ncbi:MAG: hypothetical protein Q8P29_01215 [Candidatus Levybacteria bacterium]|nr:hypothetical protein [Candidatus Levybacteria bacterium]